MRKDVQEIFKSTPHEKQVMMFSATLSSEMRAVCKKFMQDPMEIYVDDSKLTLHGLQQARRVDVCLHISFGIVVLGWDRMIRVVKLHSIPSCDCSTMSSWPRTRRTASSTNYLMRWSSTRCACCVLCTCESPL